MQPLDVRAAVRQTTRVLHSNKLLMEGIVNMQKELKNTHQQGMSMVKDLQQNTAHHRGLFASLSRDIHWIKQKQHDRKRLKQANCLLHEKNTELKDKLQAAETQAGSDKRGFEEQLQAVGSERDAARQQTEERDSALKSAQSDYSELQKERERGQAAHEEALLCIRNEAKCTRETYRRELTTLDSELHQSLQRNQAQNEASLQNLEDIRANHRTKSEEAVRYQQQAQLNHERLCGEVHAGKLELQYSQERQAQERQVLVQQHAEHSQQQEVRIGQMEASQRQQLEENEKELGRVQAEESQLRSDLERVQGELEVASQQTEKQQTSNTHNTQLVLQLKGDLDAAVSGQTKAEDAQAELRRERDALASRVEEAQAELGGVHDAARQSASEAAAKLEALERQAATLQGQEQESRRRREDLEKEMHEARRQGDEAARAARAARTESDKCEALEKKQQAAELELSRAASELGAEREQLTRESAQRQEQERDLAHVLLRMQRPCTAHALPMHCPCIVAYQIHRMCRSSSWWRSSPSMMPASLLWSAPSKARQPPRSGHARLSSSSPSVQAEMTRRRQFAASRRRPRRGPGLRGRRWLTSPGQRARWARWSVNHHRRA